MAASGSWVAYSEDRQQLALFSSEINAWRFGGPRKLDVVHWPFGLSLDEAIAAAAKDREAVR